MNTNIRSTLSAAIALGLVSFAVTSAFVSSVAAPVTLLAFGLLAVYGAVEIAIVSYRSPRLLSSARVASRTSTRAAAVIAFPVVARRKLAHAA